MGKKQHQSDKLYLTSTEWSTLYGGKKATKPDADKAEFRRLPFDSCSLILQVLFTSDNIFVAFVNVGSLQSFGAFRWIVRVPNDTYTRLHALLPVCAIEQFL